MTQLRTFLTVVQLERPWHLVASAQAELSPTATLAARCLLAAPDGFTPTPEGRRLLAA